MRLHGGEDHSDPGVLEPRRSLDFADAESSEEGEVGLILVQLLMDKIQHHLVYLIIIFFFNISWYGEKAIRLFLTGSTGCRILFIKRITSTTMLATASCK